MPVFTDKQKARIDRKLKAKQDYASKVKVKTSTLIPEDVYPDEPPPPGKDFRFTVKKGTKEVQGLAGYYKPEKAIYVYGIGDKSVEKEPMLDRAHARIKNKSMDASMVRGALEKIAKMYPKAKTLLGDRITGAKANLDRSQVFSLDKIRKVGRMARKVRRVL